MRVSIVATALDGESPETKSRISNVHRIHTRGSGYSEDISKNIDVPKMPGIGSIQGATALKLDNEIQEDQNTMNENQSASDIVKQNDLVSGISLENASYFENDLSQKQEEPEETIIDEISLYEEKSLDNSETKSDEEVSPQLFSDEENQNSLSGNNENNEALKEEEDFEIPAFLRKQKF